MGLLKKIKKAVKKTLGINDNNKPKMPKPDATLGPSGDGGDAVRRSAARRMPRGARGRDSTIITGGSEIGSRTLLG